MKPTVLVVGGYGSVGAALCRDLAHSGEFTVIVAGRRIEAARGVASTWCGEARHLDLDAPATWDAAVAGVTVVVVCMDQRTVAFPQFLLSRGVAYVDITATDGFFRAIEALPPPHRSWALLSVGLAPGLTSILARHAAAPIDRLDTIEIGILSGLGDSHGAAGLAWVADRLFDPEAERMSALVDFGERWGVRRAHSVDFSDQHTLQRTLSAGSVRTRLCFDSRLGTAAVFAVAWAFAGNRRARAAVLAATGMVRLGGMACNISVEAVGLVGGRPMRRRAWFYAEREALTTALLAAIMIRQAIAAPPPPGVHHADAVLDGNAVLAEAERLGVGRFVFDWASS